MSKENFGEIMDQACMDGDCSTPEGIASAVANCQSEVRKLPGYKFMQKACESTDLNIRQMGCSEPCDVSSVSESIIKKLGKPQCVPNTRKLNSYDGLYYCQSSTGGGWMLDPVQEEAMTKEEVEQKEKFLY